MARVRMVQLTMLIVLTPFHVHWPSVLLVYFFVAALVMLLVQSLLRVVGFRNILITRSTLIVPRIALAAISRVSIARILSICFGLLSALEDIRVLGLEFNVWLYHVKKCENLVFLILVIVGLRERLIVWVYRILFL